MVRQYETTFIVDAHLSGEKIESSIEKFINYIGKNGGKVIHVDRWGKRRLAYEIAKKQYGYYVYVCFEAEGTFIKELEREYKLDESIIRYLTVLVPKIVLKKGLETVLSSGTLKEGDQLESVIEEKPSVEEDEDEFEANGGTDDGGETRNRKKRTS